MYRGNIPLYIYYYNVFVPLSVSLYFNFFLNYLLHCFVNFVYVKILITSRAPRILPSFLWHIFFAIFALSFVQHILYIIYNLCSVYTLYSNFCDDRIRAYDVFISFIVFCHEAFTPYIRIFSLFFPPRSFGKSI